MNYITMNLKRLFKRKVNLVFLFFAPFLLVTFAAMLGNSSFEIKISYVDKDKSISSKMLIERLEKVGSVYEVPEDEIDINLLNGDHEIAVIIESGFETQILEKAAPSVKIKSIQGASVEFPVTAQVDNFLSSALTISRSSGVTAESYEKILNEYNKNQSGVSVETIQNKSITKTVSRMSIGFLFFNMLLLASQASSILIDDKKSKVFYRIFSGPVTTFKYMRDNILSFYVLMLAQIVVVMITMFGFYQMDYGEAIFDMFLLFAAFGIMSVAFGVAINTFSRTRSQSGVVSSLIITPMCMLGGFFWDIEIMPDFMQKAASFLPTSWGIKAAVQLLDGKRITDITNYILVLLLFTIGFFILGTLKKADISR